MRHLDAVTTPVHQSLLFGRGLMFVLWRGLGTKFGTTFAFTISPPLYNVVSGTLLVVIAMIWNVMKMNYHEVYWKSRVELWHYRWHRRRPAVPTVATKLASLQLTVFSFPCCNTGPSLRRITLCGMSLTSFTNVFQSWKLSWWMQQRYHVPLRVLGFHDKEWMRNRIRHCKLGVK